MNPTPIPQAQSNDVMEYAKALALRFAAKYGIYDYHETEDLCADAAMYLLMAMRNVKNETTARAYIFKCVHGCLLNDLRKQWSRNEVDLTLAEAHSIPPSVVFLDGLSKDGQFVAELIISQSGDFLQTDMRNAAHVLKRLRHYLFKELHWTRVRMRSVIRELKEHYGN